MTRAAALLLASTTLGPPGTPQLDPHPRTLGEVVCHGHGAPVRDDRDPWRGYVRCEDGLVVVARWSRREHWRGPDRETYAHWEEFHRIRSSLCDPRGGVARSHEPFHFTCADGRRFDLRHLRISVGVPPGALHGARELLVRAF